MAYLLQQIFLYILFEVLRAVAVKITVFRLVTPCVWLQIFLRNICNALPNSTASHVILMSPIHTSCDKCCAVYRRTNSPWLICAFNHCHTIKRVVPASPLHCGAAYVCLVTEQRQSERCKERQNTEQDSPSGVHFLLYTRPYKMLHVFNHGGLL